MRADWGGAGGRARGSAGSVSVKIEPTPTVLSTVMVPPRRWAKRRAMARPRPVPE
jgi:hypothetical protein